MSSPKARVVITASDRTREAVQSAMSRFQSLSKSANKLRSALYAVGGAAGIGYVIKRSLEAVDKIGKMSDAVALSTTTFQELTVAADLSGVSQEKLTQNMIAFVKRVGEARSNTGPLVTFLNKYDQTLLRAIQSTKTQEEALNLIADAIKNAKSETDRAALANAAFSRAGVTMVNMLRNGADGLEDLRQKARESGLVIEDDLVRAAERANDALTLMSKRLSTQVNKSVAENAKEIETLGNALSVVIDKSAKATSALVNFVEKSGKKIAEYTRGSWRENLEDLAALMFDPLGLVRGELNVERRLRENEEKIKKILGGGEGAQDEPEAPVVVPEDDIESAAEDERAARERERIERELQRQQERFMMRLEQVETFLMNEQEIEQRAYENRMFIIEEAFQNELISATQRQMMLEQLEQKHQKKMLDMQKKYGDSKSKLQKMSDMQMIKNALASGAQLTSGVANTNKTLFKVNKALALANAAVSLPDAVLQSFQKAGGYPWGIIPAGLMLATGLAQIQSIKNAKFGGAGGVAPSIAPTGAASTVATVPAQEPSDVEEINIGGNDQESRIVIELDGDKVGEAIVNRAEDGRLNLATQQ